MPRGKKTLVFTGELREKLKRYIAERCGLYFKDHEMKNLAEAVAERMKARGIDSFPAYYQDLTGSREGEREFRELLNLLTVQHTYFFRNEPQFRVLREKILTDLVNEKRKAALQSGREKPVLRIWSAGCATGEEPYSIAILVKELIPDLSQWRIEILATDISDKALERARKGSYRKSSLRLVPESLKEKYFEEKSVNRNGGSKAYYSSHSDAGKVNKVYAVNNDIKKLVQFGYFNLMDKNYPAGFDVIFCRNVFIYFNLENVIDVVARFSTSLRDDGYFFIGYSESLQFIAERFRLQQWQEAVFYRKKEWLPAPAPERPQVLPPSRRDKALQEVSQTELEAVQRDAAGEKKFTAQQIKKLLGQIIKQIYLKHYDLAVSYIREAQKKDEKIIDLYCLAAEVFMNQGKPGPAEDELAAALKINKLFPPAHFLLGTLCQGKGSLEEAKTSFKRAIYLDKNFIMAHFNLAQVLKNEGLVAEAVRAYRNTARLLLDRPLEDVIAYSGGFNAAALAGVCRSNIERLKE